MANTIFPAAAEGMPKSTLPRRAALSALTGTAIAVTSVAALSMESEPPTDPLLDAIIAYQRGLRDYEENASGDDEADAYAESSYLPPMEVLEEWEKPVLTQTGAIAAIRLAFQETHEYHASPIVETMLCAAIAYLDPTDGEQL